MSLRFPTLLAAAASLALTGCGDRAILRLTPEAAKAPEEPGEST